jgi:hypothetical protein
MLSARVQWRKCDVDDPTTIILFTALNSRKGFYIHLQSGTVCGGLYFHTEIMFQLTSRRFYFKPKTKRKDSPHDISSKEKDMV